MLFSTEKILF